MTFDFDEDELELLRRALDNYAAYERSQRHDERPAERLLEPDRAAAAERTVQSPRRQSQSGPVSDA